MIINDQVDAPFIRNGAFGGRVNVIVPYHQIIRSFVRCVLCCLSSLQYWWQLSLATYSL